MDRALSAVAAPLAAAVLLAVAGCGGGGQSSPSAESLVGEAARATGDVRSFHFTLDVQGVPRTSAGLQLTSAEGDVATPDRVTADVGGNFAGVPITAQVVAIGDAVWLENPLSGRWEQIDVGTGPVALLDPAKGVLSVMEGISRPIVKATEEVDGVTLQQVSGTAPAADVAPLVAVSPSQRDVSVVLWIGEDDHLVRRIELSGPVARGESSKAKRVIELSRFDEPVTVEAPKERG